MSYRSAQWIHTLVKNRTVAYPEEQFERALASVIQTHLQDNVASVIVPRFGLDIAIFLPHPIASRVLLVEAKSYRLQRQGGVGFRDKHVKGPQVDLLLSSVDQLAILDSHGNVYLVGKHGIRLKTTGVLHKKLDGTPSTWEERPL